MPAYNFQPQFEQAIMSDRKRHTIRAKRKRRPKVGDTNYLFTGMRTKKCKRLKARRCVRVQEIRIGPYRATVNDPVRALIISIDGVCLTYNERQALARSDGFASLAGMVDFWVRHNKLGVKPWAGDLIHWESDAEYEKRLAFEKAARFEFETTKRVYDSNPKFITPEMVARAHRAMKRKPSGRTKQKKDTKSVRYFLDTEFIESGPGSPIWLLSIGIVAEDGRELYYVNSDAPLADANDWVKENVFPQLIMERPGYPKCQAPLETIRERVRAFCAGYESFRIIPPEIVTVAAKTALRPEFWGYYADYDWVVVCQMFGCMIDLPEGWPMYCRDLKQWADDLGNPRLPEQKTAEHNALNDARWNRETYNFLLHENNKRYPDPNRRAVDLGMTW